MLISIIVPVYKIKEEQFIKCVESLLHQTYRNIEIILVDDGSPDQCPALCDRIQESDDRVIVIHQKNKGLSGARNSGQRIAKGEYLMFVDGDDYIDTNAVERLVEEAEKNAPDVITSRLNATSKAENTVYYPFENRKIYQTKSELYYMNLTLFNFKIKNANTIGKLYKASFLHNNNLYHDELLKQGAEDLEFNVRVFQKASSIEVLTRSFYHYVYNSESISRSFNEENEYLLLKCFESVYNHINKDDSRMLKWYYSRLKSAIISAAISGFFNPTNKLSYRTQVSKLKKYLRNPTVKRTMSNTAALEMDVVRKVVLICLRMHIFFPVKLIATMRYNQKAKHGREKE